MLIGILLILLGFVIVFFATILSLLRLFKRGGGEAESEKRGGAVVMVGPLPIVLASDPKTARVLIILAIILTLLLAAFTVANWLMRLG